MGCGVPGTTGHALVLHTSPGHPAAHGSTGTHQFSHPCNVDVFGEPPKEGEGKPLMNYTSLFTRLISFPKRKEQLRFPTPLSVFLTLCVFTITGIHNPSPVRGIWVCICFSEQVVSLRKARTVSWSLQHPPPPSSGTWLACCSF